MCDKAEINVWIGVVNCFFVCFILMLIFVDAYKHFATTVHTWVAFLRDKTNQSSLNLLMCNKDESGIAEIDVWIEVANCFFVLF